jgi:hypothetical protein
VNTEASGLPGVSGFPGGPRRTWVVALVCGALPLALLTAMVAVPAALWSRLPARVADHWTINGTANGTMPRVTAFLILGLLAVPGIALVLVGWAAARRAATGTGRGRGPGTRAIAGTALIPLGLFLMAQSVSFVIMVAVANLGGGGPRSADVNPVSAFLPPAGAALIAGFGGYALRRHGGLGVADAAPGPSLGLRAGERAVWIGRTRARWAWPAGLLLAGAGAATGIAAGQWTPGALLLLTGVLMLGFTSVRVRVAAHGVTVGYGALGLRLTRIPLRRIASAEAVERTSFAFGYRGSLLLYGAAAVVLRRGPALRLTLRDGKTFLVTVDDAATGAALLNDLIAATD